MNHKARRLAYGAVIGALYAALTFLQNLLVPGSATWAIQLRVSEALCVLAFFTPAAVPGLTVGCLIFNLTFASALPLDAFVGALATYLAAQCMWLLRRWKLVGLFMPALFNGLLVGWELAAYMGGGFWMNAGYVAAGEALVLLTLGLALDVCLRARNLDKRLFS